MDQQTANITPLQGAHSQGKGCASHACAQQVGRGVRARSMLSIAVLVAGYALLVPGAEARIDNPCTSDWTMADANNRLKCPESVSAWLAWSEKSGTVYTLIPAILGILLLVLGLPMLLVSRYCLDCCGSAKMRPGYACCGGEEFDTQSEQDKALQYDAAAIIAVKASTVFATLLAIGAIVLMYFGAQDTKKGLEDVVPRSRSLLSTIEGLVDEAKTAVATAAAQGVTYPFPIAEVEDTIGRAKDGLDDVEEAGRPFTDAVTDPPLTAALVSIVPCLLVATLIVAALFNVRYCLPLAVVVCCFIVQMVWFMIGSAALVVNVGFESVCDEAAAVKNNEIGILSWYGLPLCEDKIKEAKAAVIAAPETLARGFCEFVDDRCGDPVICPNPIPTCTTVADAQAFFDGVSVTGDSRCTGTCSLERCATDCTGTRQSGAQQVAAGLQQLSQIVDVQQKLLPWLDCRAVALRVTDDVLPAVCSNTRDGMGMLAGGALLMACTLVCTIMEALLGQKRFIKQRKARPIAKLMGVDSFLCPAEPAPPPPPPVELITIPQADNTTTMRESQRRAKAAADCVPEARNEGHSRSSSELSMI